MNAAASSNSSRLPPTYYINSQNLAQHVGRSCRLIGQVLQVANGGVRVQVESADGGIVTVLRPPGSEMYASKFVSITGIVLQDMTLRESAFESFGDSFNLPLFNKTIGLMSSAHGLFATM